ncbi:glycosyltransferase family 2 protein [Novosphingobium sp. KCTC 2891]|uniref:glycosyltransferase family 2 protein n=1 Tax=Novosphingobium sp. KCTC 2891 TaxID=2989730 RepID=UPI0022213D33|nr:glycosyltransferase family 2 protein [Novosphingobium sp. KCTC 2891]MCW1383299.1 glycosyltransferase family 2 protein [Novosphingobium sp. KCTC 2891]
MLQDLQDWQIEGAVAPWRKPGRVGLSVVIPCYNEAPVIDALLARLEPVCEAASPGDYEIVLVNDGSTDGTWSLIDAHAARSAHVVGVDLARNHGHQLALTCGLQVCRGDLVLVIDADLQDPPELLPQMMRLVREGYDVVYGQRVAREGETLFKKASAALFYRVLEKMIDIAIPRDAGDFRLMTRPVVDALNAMPERFRFVRGMVSWVGFRQVAIPYHREARFAGETHYPLSKMLALAFDAVTSFSVKPLRMASLCGVLFGMAGLALLGWVLAVWLQHGTVSGWTSMIGVSLIMGSVQLIVLGVFGEYLGRMYIETKGRPMYIVREVRRGGDGR